MAKLQYSGPNHSSPRWMGQWGDRHSLVPGGGILDIYGITETKGIRQLPSGSMIARTPDQKKWDVTIDSATNFATITTEAITAGSRKIPLQSASGYKAGLVVEILAVDYTVQSVDIDRNIITLTAGVSSNLAKGVDVFYPVGSEYTEFYLTAFDVEDANQCADVELYRHGSLVYIDFLPNFSSFANSLGIISRLQTNYQCIWSNK